MPIGEEKIPSPGAPGLMHGVEAPLRVFLSARRSLVERLYAVLRDSEAQDHLSFVNMMWVQRYPLDFEAAAVDSTRLANIVSRRLAQSPGSGSSPLPSSNPANSVSVFSETKNLPPLPLSGGTNTDLRALESRMKFILFLNLGLRFAPNSWTPLLQLRDEKLDSLRRVDQAFETELRALKIDAWIERMPTLQRIHDTIHHIVRSIAFAPVHASVQELEELLFTSFSSGVVELNFALHDMTDLVRHRKVLDAAQRAGKEAVALCRTAVEFLQEFEGQNKD
jgi:hypothetical protein